MECNPIKIVEYSGHLPVLYPLSKKIALMKLPEEIKFNSLKWVKTYDESIKNFYWLHGYEAFSVSHGKIAGITVFITD